METTPITPNPTATTLPTEQASQGLSEQNVNASDFLNLLITQMSNQDPLDPLDDKEFMAQLAQFSSLEEMSSLNTTMKDFVQRQQTTAASTYLGREVSILTESGARVEGIVSAVSGNNAEGKVEVTVNDRPYDVDRIEEVRLPSSS